MEELAQRIVDQIRALLNGYAAALYLQDVRGDLIAITTSGDLGPLFRPGLLLPKGSGISALVVEAGTAITSPDILNDPRVTLTEDAHRLIAESPARAVLAVPLVVGNAVIGAISVGAAVGRQFTDAERVLAQAFADQAAVAIENARLYRESVAHQQTLTTMVEVARKLTTRLDLAAVLETVSTAAVEVFNAEVGFRLREGDDLVLQSATPGARKVMVRERLKVGESISGKVAATGEPILTTDVPADPRNIPEHRFGGPATGALMCVPIRGGSRILGTLNIYRERGQQFTDADLAAAMHLAAQAGVALENAFLYQRSLQEAERTRVLASVARALSESLDVDLVGRRIAESTRALLDVNHAAIYRLDPETHDLTALAATQELEARLGPNVRFPAGVGAIGRAVIDRAVFISPNVLSDPRITLTPELRRGIERSTWRAVLTVPLFVGEEIIGVIGIGDREGRVFQEDEIRLAEAFAAHAALALQNAKLYESSRTAYETLSRAQEDRLRVERLRAIGELSAGAAHHLNNLLLVVLARLDLALQDCPEPRLRRQLDIARRASRDSADVVRRLVRFSRGHVAGELVPVDLNEIVREVIELTRPRWQDELLATGVAVTVEADLGNVPSIAADPVGVREVLMNLVFNAIDALPSGGTIVLATAPSATHVVCRVSDDGTGMSEEVQRRAIEPFFTTRGIQRTGLGLSAAYGIMRWHDGTLRIDSEEGHGARITLEFPLAVKASTPNEEAAAPVSLLHVLVVDDEPDVRSVIADGLRDDGHVVTEAGDGSSAMAAIAADPSIEIVLTDLGMPGMTGWQLARDAKAQRPSLVVGLITGWGEEPDARPEQRASVDFVLAKPYSRETIRRELTRHQRR